MENQPDPLLQLMQLATLDAAERYPGIELSSYLDGLEPIDGRLKLTWACTSAREAFGNIIESVWNDELGRSTEVVHVAERDDPCEQFPLPTLASHHRPSD